MRCHDSPLISNRIQRWFSIEQLKRGSVGVCLLGGEGGGVRVELE
jgi:hypothetical protein